MTRYTLTLADGTSLSTEAADSQAAHDTVARYTGVPLVHGFYAMFSRMRYAEDWTKREIGYAARQNNYGRDVRA
jgi:hypothetical protein